MAPVAAHLALVGVVRQTGAERVRLDGLVTVRALGPVLHVLLGQVSRAVPVHLLLLVTVHAHHTLLVVNIRGAAVFTGIFRVYAAPVAEGAGLSLVLLDELMTLDKPEADARYRRGFHVTGSAGGVAAPAGLLEDLAVEGLHLLLGEPGKDPVPLAQGGVVEGLAIVRCGLLVAGCTHLQIVGGPLDHAGMGLFLGGPGLVTLVT